MSNKKLPPNYFEKFEATLENNLASLEDNINETAPLLVKLSQKSPFVTPEEYFEKNLLNVNRGKASSNKVISLGRKLSAIAASLLIMISLTYWINNPSNSIDRFELTEANMIDYIVDSDRTIEDDLLLELNLDNFNEDLSDLNDLSDIEFDLYINSILDELTLNDVATISEINEQINF